MNFIYFLKTKVFPSFLKQLPKIFRKLSKEYFDKYYSNNKRHFITKSNNNHIKFLVLLTKNLKKFPTIKIFLQKTVGAVIKILITLFSS